MFLDNYQSVKRCLLLYAAGLIWSVTYGAVAEPSEKSFAGQEIEWIVPFKAGGGSDTSARFYAPFLQKHLPGNPVIKIKNIPGGASTKAANIFANKVRSDGLSMLGTSASTQFAYLLGDPRVRYNYEKWSILMASQTGGVVYISPQLGIKDSSELAKIADRKLYYGSQGTTSVDLVPLLAFDFLGLNVRPIFGISGRAIGRLAFERGDATIDFQTSAAYLKSVQPLVDQGRAIPLFSLGVLSASGELVRDPNFPDLPHVMEVYKDVTGKEPTGIAWESWMAFVVAGFAVQDILVVPAQTEPSILKAFHEAIEKMKLDPVYQREKSRTTGDYEVVSGAASRRLYKLATEVDVAHKNWLAAWLKKKYNVNLKG